MRSSAAGAEQRVEVAVMRTRTATSRQRLERRAGVVAALAADEGHMADDEGNGGALAARWRDELRAWLRVRPLQQEEAAQLEAIRARGRAAHALQAAEPPPWRTREDWKADLW